MQQNDTYRVVRCALERHRHVVGHSASILQTSSAGVRYAVRNLLHHVARLWAHTFCGPGFGV